MKKRLLDMKTRRRISRLIAERYQRARKKEKGKILDEFVELTGYNRRYGGWLLRNIGSKRVIYIKGRRYIVVGKDSKGQKGIRKRPVIYDEGVVKELKKVWYILDMPAGKRLAPYLKEIIPILEERKELEIERDIREKLLKVSAATIDRLLKEEKKKWRIRGKKRTKPGSLLKSQIPIRTFAEWNEKVPGFIEIDLVEHSGGVARGIYAQTLDATDIFTGWTETICIENKSQVNVFEGLQKIIKQYPFVILGIDSDNGSEFINQHLIKFCQENKITFTRSRSYKKNDNCYVEQKNWSIVRKTVGYSRYETEKEINLINQIYFHLRLYTNFFQPQMKLINKTRIGSKVTKKYDKAKTPYQRVIECEQIDKTTKEKLKQIYKGLNPVKLKREIVSLQCKLFELIRKKKTIQKKEEIIEKEKIFV